MHGSSPTEDNIYGINDDDSDIHLGEGNIRTDAEHIHTDRYIMMQSQWQSWYNEYYDQYKPKWREWYRDYNERRDGYHAAAAWWRDHMAESGAKAAAEFWHKKVAVAEEAVAMKKVAAREKVAAANEKAAARGKAAAEEKAAAKVKAAANEKAATETKSSG